MNNGIKLLHETEFEIWDQYVLNHPAGTIFHTTQWLKLISDEVQVLSQLKEGSLTGGIALIKTKKYRVKGFHIPPYTQFSSPLFGNLVSVYSISEENAFLEDIINNLPAADHIDFKLPRGHQNILPYIWKGFDTNINLTYVVEGSLENYLSKLNKNKLRELNKLFMMLQTGELLIEETIGKEELSFVLKATSARKKFDFHDNIAMNIVLNAPTSFTKKIIIRSKTTGVLAFGFFPFDDKCVYNLINASVRVEHSVLKTINLLLIYKAIEFALSTGRIFDFEGSMLKGIENFCRLMGGVQYPIYRVQKSPALSYSVLRALKQIRNDRKKA